MPAHRIPSIILVILTMSAIAFAAEPQTLLLLHFDEGAGPLAKDASGLCYDGRIRGATWIDGRFGKALHFDGKGQVDLGQPPALEFGKVEDFSIECWVRIRPDTPPNFYFILTNRLRLEDTPGYTIFLNKGFQVAAAVGDKVNWIDLLTAPTPINDGQWHHVALTCDRDATASLYLDGQAQGSSSMAEIVTVSNNELPLLIGSRGYSGDFIGDIDEVRISRGVRRIFSLDKPHERQP